jgi:serine protease Do
MRRFDRLSSWTLLVVAVLLGAAALLFLETHSRAATESLWSSTPPNLPAGQSRDQWVAVAKADTAAVVNISTTQVVKNPFVSDNRGNPNDPFQEFFRQFMGNMPRTYRTHSLGSGFIVRSDGYIVTNNHVVDSATDITVKLPGDRRFKATVIGRDPKTDLALLKIDSQNLPTVSFGNSDTLQVGEPVMAIGNPFGLEGTVTTGIVSAKGRVIGEGPYDDFIQTDASINPGNSGGPLVNQAGQVVGINTAIVSQSGGSVGIGFAIPINEAKSILPQLEAKGHVTRGWLGVSIQSMTPELAKAFKLEPEHGALVADVVPNSPAAKAGLKTGDVITEYDGHAIAKTGDLPRLVSNAQIGHSATMRVLRDGKPLTVTAQIATLPESEQPAEATPTGGKSLGLTVRPLTPALAKRLEVPDKVGLVVTEVTDGSPADQAGIQPGDVIVEVNRQPARSVAAFRKAIADQKVDEPTLMRIHRKEASLFVAIETPHASQG